MNKFNTMNIHALKGTKVYFMDCNGYDSELNLCRELGLKKGQCLTISHTIVDSFSTKVYFEEFSDTQCFNSVHFTEDNFLNTRTIQFKHERHFDSKGNLKAKGGRTIALEVPTLEEFKAFKPDIKSPALHLHIGIAECSKKDHYNKKLGRNIAQGRMKHESAFVTLVSESEVQLVIGGVTVILRKHKNTDKVYFEEVV